MMTLQDLIHAAQTVELNESDIVELREQLTKDDAEFESRQFKGDALQAWLNRPFSSL